MQLEPPSIQVIVEDETDFEYMPDLIDSLAAYFFDGAPPRPLINLVIENINEKKISIHSHLVAEFFSDKEKNLPRVERIPFEIKFQGIYVLGKNGKKFPVSNINSAVIATLNEKDPDKTEIRRYENFTSKDNKAEVVSIETGSKKRLEVVNRTETGEISFFSSDEHGQIKKLGIIASYDPEKDEWSFLNRKNIDANN